MPHKNSSITQKASRTSRPRRKSPPAPYPRHAVDRALRIPKAILGRCPGLSWKLRAAIHGYFTPPPAGWLAAIHQGSL